MMRLESWGEHHVGAALLTLHQQQRPTNAARVCVDVEVALTNAVVDGHL